MNEKTAPNRRLTRIYGITFMTNEEETNRINEALKQNGSALFYMPRKFRMGIYFYDQQEAFNVVQFLNKQNNGRHYHTFPTSLESLRRIKEDFENNKKLKKDNPIMYHKLTGYKLYVSANEYFSTINEQFNKEEIIK